MIAGWTSKDAVMASYRKDGALYTRRIGDAEYVAFYKADANVNAIHGAVDDQPDFDGWRKIWFADYDSRKSALQRNPSLLFEADVSPVRRFVSDHKVVLDKPFRCFTDIETNPEIPFSQKEETRLLCAVIKGEDGRVDKYMLEDDCDEAEAELWEAYYEGLSRYDQCMAWNGDGFDFEVMKERIKRLSHLRKFTAYWENRGRLMLVDQLAAYKRFNTASESGDEKTSNSLGSVARALKLGGKTEGFHAKDGMKAWRSGDAGRKELLDYCAQDVELLPLIDGKVGHLDIFQTLCSLTTAFPNSHGLKPIAQFDAMLLRKANLAKTHLPSKIERAVEPYEGAFVMDSSVRGIERTVHVCDFASLYPSVLRTFNMGWETIVEEGGSLVPRTGVRFATEVESMLAGVIRECMELRVVHKKRKASLTPGTEEWKDADRTSTAYKVFVNSGYGVIGSPYSRFYNLKIVESITLGGQWLIKATIAAAEARGWRCVYGDTDSVFVTGCTVEEFEEFTTWCNSVLYPKLLAEQGCNPKFACVKLSYEKCFDRLIVPQGADGDPAGKRYAGSYLHYEGKPGLPIPKIGEAFDKEKHSKPEIKGLEYKRGDSIAFARQAQEELIMRILSGEADEETLEEWVMAKRALVMGNKLTLDQIVTTKGLSQPLSQYKVDSPHVRVARAMAEAGEDVSEGTRIPYIVTDGSVSPTAVIHADRFDGTNADPYFYWIKAIYPCLRRVLAGAFPQRNWNRWTGKRPKPVLPGQLGLNLT